MEITGNAPPRATPAPPQQALKQEDFLKLMVAQIKNQDPTEPLDPNDYLAQLAQFSTVEGITQVNTGINNLALAMRSNQTLQAAGLVGRSAVVASNNVVVPSYPADGAPPTTQGRVNLTVPADNLTVTIRTTSGTPVRVLELGRQPDGRVAFAWDGKDSQGRNVPEGSYTIGAQADGRAVPTLVGVRIASVAQQDNGNFVLYGADGRAIQPADIYEYL